MVIVDVCLLTQTAKDLKFHVKFSSVISAGHITACSRAACIYWYLLIVKSYIVSISDVDRSWTCLIKD